MGIEGFERNLSEESKKALQSQTWQKVRDGMKEKREALQAKTPEETGNVIKTEPVHFTYAPEMQHFAIEKFSKGDNAYGVGWGELVREYLLTAYSESGSQAELTLDGVTYKVQDRREVTSFYDAHGNTLFDVENKRLEKEHGWLTNADGEVDPVVEQTEEAPGAGAALPAESKGTSKQDSMPVKQRAEEKLKKELAAAKDKSFADPIIGYLLERCREDEGLAEDVAQEHKTWKKCFDYIYSQARKQAKGNCAAVRDDVVCEWAEDYYHRDDKAKEAEKARKEAEIKEHRKKVAAKQSEKTKKEPAKAVPAAEKKEGKPKEQSKPKKNNKDMDGQLDLFSMMGM